MVQTQLISLRVDAITLARIDDIVNRTGARCRSAVINSILDNVTSCMEYGDLRTMLQTYDAYSAGYVIKFSRKN